MSQRAARPGEVQTVLGPLDPGALGIVLPHEHILCDVTPPELAARSGGQQVEITLKNVHEVRYHWIRHYGNHILEDAGLAADELALFREAGGGAVVELTIEGIRPQPAALAEVSRRSGVPIVAGVGFYIESFAGEAIRGRSDDDLARFMIGGVRDGLHGTDVRAGIIGEIGVSDPWSRDEQRVMAAAVVAQRETGATINVHPGRDPSSPLAVARFVRARGGDPTRLVLSHMDRTLFEADALARLMDEGCVAEWDFFGIESSHYPFADLDLPNDGQRLNLIRDLVRRGYGDRILISQDICTRTRLTRWGGHGYAHLVTAVIAMMRRKGFSQDEIDMITRHSPARLLTLVTPAQDAGQHGQR
jgi:phosphotriesterase-related protein